MLAFLHHLDLALLYRINTVWIGPFLDWLMPTVSDPQVFKWPVAAAVLALLLFGGFRERVFLVLLLLAVGIGDGVIDNYGKKLVGRPRPNEALPGLRVVTRGSITASRIAARPRGRSFPSGHTCNNVALAMVACAVYGRRARWVWLWAALVAYSRVYLAAHYPSDVLGSLVLSIAYCTILFSLTQRAWARWAPARWRAAHPELLPLRANRL